MDDLYDLALMAYVYAFTCTKQEEKFKDKKYIDYTWSDCIAAYELLNESTTGMERHALYERIRKNNGTKQ